MIPLLETRGQCLRWSVTGITTTQSIEVDSTEGAVASLVVEREARVLLGHTHDQVWRFDFPDFYLKTPGEAPRPSALGHVEIGRAVTFSDSTRFVWRTTSFWKSREGFCDHACRCLVEFSIGKDLWIHGNADDAPYLPILLFVGLIHRRFGKHEGTGISRS